MNNGYYVINLHVKPICRDLVANRIHTNVLGQTCKGHLSKLRPVRGYKATDWSKYDLHIRMFCCFCSIYYYYFPWLFSTSKKQHHRIGSAIRMRVSACMNAFTRTLTIADNNFCWLQIIFVHEVHLHLWQLQLQSQLHNFYGKWTIYLDFHPIHCYFR